MTESVQLSRDVFARATLVRKLERSSMPCENCGNWRKAGPWLFRYGSQPDGLHTRVNWDLRLFCNKACRDAFYGG